MPSNVWRSGFYDGVLSALACVDAANGSSGGEYRDIVRACGGHDLLRAAQRRKDSQTRNIRAALDALASTTSTPRSET